MLNTSGATPEGQRQYAFTLTELLVCIAILALIAGILLPVLMNAREKSRAANCMTDMRQVGLAERMYLSENDDVYAPDVLVKNVFGRQRTQSKGCPSAGGEERESPGLPGIAHNGQLHGVLDAGLRAMRDSDVYAPPVTVSIGEVSGPAVLTGWIGKQERGRRHHQGSNFLFCDGHAKWHLSDTVGSIEDRNDGTKPTFNPYYHVPN
jgi:prepilin-type N-terminal cleavage/methylation domain-containing protein/prepilin-type processing-associated H-X9-DG protein